MTDKQTPTDAELIAVAGEPFGYFHQLLNHEGKGNGVWLGAAERKVVEQAHTPGETSEEIVALYTTPQPTHARAGALPLTPDQIAEIADAAHREYDRLVSSGQCAPRWSAVFAHLLEMHHGIKGGQHGTE